MQILKYNASSESDNRSGSGVNRVGVSNTSTGGGTVIQGEECKWKEGFGRFSLVPKYNQDITAEGEYSLAAGIGTQT